jgi:hypothetical protein
MLIPPLSFVAIELLLIVIAATWLFFSWRRQSYRFNLRWLFFAIGLAAFALFVVVQHAIPIATHRWAIRGITSAGGDITFHDETSAQYLSPESRRELEHQSWRPVQRIRMADDVSAASVAWHIEYLPEVRHFTLWKNVTDAGLRDFCDAAAEVPIESLCLFGSSTTSFGIVQLAKLKHLRTLFIHNGAMNDEGLGHLKSMPALESLWILEQDDSGNPDQFTAKGFAEIGKLDRLRSLQLHGLKMSDAAVSQLHGLTRLEFLMLDQCEISDVALVDLCVALPECSVNVTGADSSETLVSP